MQCGDLHSRYTPDPNYDSETVFSPTPGLGPDAEHDDRYYAVDCDASGDGPNTIFSQRFETGGVSISTALSEVMSLTLPSDARLVWKMSFPSCYAADYESSTLKALGLGDGNVTFELGSGDAPNNLVGNFEPAHITDALFTPPSAASPVGYEC